MSRPYFIGLLGDRYGWVPDEIPTDLADREAWLADVDGKSVTEMEVLHGVLNDPDMANHAFFYFRDPAFLEQFNGEGPEPVMLGVDVDAVSGATFTSKGIADGVNAALEIWEHIG